MSAVPGAAAAMGAVLAFALASVRHRARVRFPKSCVVTALYSYPVKGCRGISHDCVAVTELGLACDRQWMVVDDRFAFISQRTHPGLALVQVKIDDVAMHLSCPEKAARSTLSVALRPRGERAKVKVRVWDAEVDGAEDEGDEAARWFSSVLNDSVRLVRFNPAQCSRPIRRFPSEQVAFADAFPCLLANDASIAELNRRLCRARLEPVTMDRFRPNVVINGIDAFVEDGRFTLRGEHVVFEAVKPCDRCKVPTIDQSTGVASAQNQPTAMLKTFRRIFDNHDVFFGNNMLVRTTGTLRVGEVLALEWTSSLPSIPALPAAATLA